MCYVCSFLSFVSDTFTVCHPLPSFPLFPLPASCALRSWSSRVIPIIPLYDTFIFVRHLSVYICHTVTHVRLSVLSALICCCAVDCIARLLACLLRSIIRSINRNNSKSDDNSSSSSSSFSFAHQPTTSNSSFPFVLCSISSTPVCCLLDRSTVCLLCLCSDTPSVSCSSSLSLAVSRSIVLSPPSVPLAFRVHPLCPPPLFPSSRPLYMPTHSTHIRHHLPAHPPDAHTTASQSQSQSVRTYALDVTSCLAIRIVACCHA